MIVHQCDLCKEITQEYITCSFPVNEYVYLELQGVKQSKFHKGIKTKVLELCPKCSQTLANFLDSYLNS